MQQQHVYTRAAQQQVQHESPGGHEVKSGRLEIKLQQQE
jgi:hypothetical protein